MPGLIEKNIEPESSSWTAMLDKELEFFAELEAASAQRYLQSSGQTGLSNEEAEKRLLECGENSQSKRVFVRPLRIFVHQFQSSVVLLLLAAAVASMIYREYLQAAGILLAVLINALTGFYMEYKAGLSLASLEALSGLTVRTIRSGSQIELPATQLVPGDLVILEAGTRVPADIRLIEAASLCTDESALTGESTPVFKVVDVLEKQDSSTGSTKTDLQNLAFHGTLVVGGRGRGLVLKTGERSSLGRLGKLLESTEAGATPLECQLEELGKQLCLLTVVICAVVSFIGILHHENTLLMVETGIALAVAAIPEGLPVLATLALAVGTQRMVRFKSILRHLAAVETLGCTSIICTDKTGTLTENQMTVCKLYVKDRALEVLGAGYTPLGEFLENGEVVSADDDALLQELLRAGALCNDSKLEKHDAKEGWHVHGDPTEGALLTLAQKAGVNVTTLQSEQARLDEIPFDLSRKRMSTLHKLDDSNFVIYTKGAPGILIDLCSSVLSADGEAAISAELKQRFRDKNEEFAKNGLRVLALARKQVPDATCLGEKSIESDLTLIGLVAMRDPPKEGVREAIQECKRAGIKVLMLTGDQALTAEAVATDLGISTHELGSLITGKELQNASEDEISKVMDKASVLARVTPELKLKIVKTLQSRGNIVSMTGDGVNDAPALKQANIGVAMGQQGTDLARSVSQMVITDDNFSTIVKAIEQGRIIYLNIQRAVGYLLTASLSSVITVALGIICDVGLPLNPLQLLWLNLIMHIFPGLGIVLQKGETSVMDEAPRNPASRLVAPAQQWQICMRSLVVSLAVLYAIAQSDKAAGHTTTIGLCTLSLCLLFQAWSWLSVDAETNKKGKGKRVRKYIGKAMLLNMALAYLFLFAAIYMPGLTNILSTSPLNGSELLFSLFVALASLCCTSLIARLPLSSLFSKTTLKT